AGDRAGRVPGVGAADVARHAFSSRAEERDQQRELKSGEKRGRKDGQTGHDAPADHVAVKSDAAEVAEEERQNGDAVAERQRHGEKDCFQRAADRESGNGGAAPATDRIEKASAADAEERNGQDQSEGERRAAEE